MLTHVVLFKFNPDSGEPAIQRALAALRELPGKISEIQEFRVGADIFHSERSYDMALISSFADQDALQRYQVHPEHQKVVAYLKTIASSIVVVDFMS